MRYVADISPAIRELKKLHLALLDYAAKKGAYLGIEEAKRTIISVVPGDRRVERGWYKFKMWESKVEDMLHQLDQTHRPEKFHEIFIAGEALKGKPADIVLLMMHQVAHQAAGIPSIHTYHGEYMKIWLSRLFDIEEEAITREPTLGWVTIDRSKIGAKAEALVQKLAKNIKTENIDLFRDELKKPEKTGRMYLWYCDCQKPKLRTGGILRGTCDVCGTKFKFHSVEDAPQDFLDRVPDELLP